MAKKISGAEYPLMKVFSSDFLYQIPKYQRPYAWTTDQASELFDDLYEFHSVEGDEGYFLGSIVLIKEDGKPLAEVIDGQQRLTTLTILIAAMASYIADQAKRLQFMGYLCEPGNELEGLDARPRLTLRSKDSEFFQTYVQGLRFDELASLDDQQIENEAQRNIKANAVLIRKRLEDRFAGSEPDLISFGKFLLQRCFLVAVWTPSQQSAFRVFSVMNSRGLDLQPTDIVKADVIGKIDESLQEEFSERWEDLEVDLGRQGFNDLFAYVRMIFAKEKSRRSLLEEFRAHVLPSISHPTTKVVEVLETYAEALAIVRRSNYSAVSDSAAINGYLRWLNRIDNSDWVPPAIEFLKQHKGAPEYVLWFFAKLERLAACMHVCGCNVNFRIERYAKLLKALEKPSSMDNPIREVDLTKDEIENMLEAIGGNVYELTARRRNYLILRLDSFLSDGAATYDHAILTIEHVLPQTVSEGSEWAQVWPESTVRWQWVHKIANLVPLNFRRNAKASNYDFAKKKTAYFGGSKSVSSFVLTTQVLQTERWTQEHVEERQEELLKVMADRWDLRLSE